MEELIAEYGKRGIHFCAVKITELSDKMFAINNEAYKDVSPGGKEFEFAQLDQSTDKFRFAITTTSISASISSTGSNSPLI
jgi:hypothetical protein